MTTDPAETSQPLRQPGRYGAVAIAFHWLTFVLVVLVGVLGLLHDDWPKQTQSFWINIHAVLGIALWLLLIARFAWRLSHKPPLMAENLGRFARRFSSPVHISLYALLFVIPLIGFVTFIYHGRVFDFGLFQIDFGIEKNRAVFAPTEDIHGYLAYALFTLAALHAAAALWHHFYLRDAVLRRMWPCVLIVVGLQIAPRANAGTVDRITIVGSSTVHPFSALVAAHFARSGPFPSPLIRATGTACSLKQ